MNWYEQQAETNAVSTVLCMILLMLHISSSFTLP